MSNGFGDWFGEQTEKLKKLKKIKITLTILGGASSLLIIVIPVIAIMVLLTTSETVFNTEKISNKNYSFDDKMLDANTTKGWVGSEKYFVEHLKQQDNFYRRLQFKEVPTLDFPLLTSTIFYDRVITRENFETSLELSEAEHKDDYDYLPGSEHVIAPDKVRSFYRMMNSQMGRIDTLGLGKRRLLGHLVRVEVHWGCTDDYLAAWAAWKELIRLFNNSFEETGFLFKTKVLIPQMPVMGDPKSIMAALNKILTIISFSQQGYNYFNYVWQNIAYEGREMAQILGIPLEKILSATDLADKLPKPDYEGLTEAEIAAREEEIRQQLKDQGGSMINGLGDLFKCFSQGLWPYPVISYTLDYGMYKDYLEKVYVPFNFVECDDCPYKNASSSEKNQIITMIVNSIYNEREGHVYNLDGFKLPDKSSTVIWDSSITGSEITEFFPGSVSSPLQGYTGGNITSGYFYRVHPITGEADIHTGVDISWGGIYGTPVQSVADGDIVLVQQRETGYGRMVLVGHDIDGDGKYDLYTRYAHMSTINVVQGSKIGGGQKIGEVGSTGMSTGPHLHFEVLDSNKAHVDPMPYLNGILSGNSAFENKTS